MNRARKIPLVVRLCGNLMLLSPQVATSQANPVLADFYVAPVGQDNWSGRLAAPNASRTDGPFVTLARARDAVRSLRVSGAAAAPISVLVRGGTYFLGEPLVFGPEDSGTADVLIAYAGYPAEKVILSGGLAITGWKPTRVGRKSLWVAKVPSGVPLSSRQLFVNGGMLSDLGGIYTIDRSSISLWHHHPE